MEDSADIELYEKIVGNPAYSSSSDTSKSDPVSFQFKEPRQTECREEDFFARVRSRRPDPRIISHALAGKKIVKSRDLATRLSSVGVLEGSFMTIVRYWCRLQIHLYSTHLQQWRPMWSPLVELPYATLLRYWRPTWGQRQTLPYSTSVRDTVSWMMKLFCSLLMIPRSPVLRFFYAFSTQRATGYIKWLSKQ